MTCPFRSLFFNLWGEKYILFFPQSIRLKMKDLIPMNLVSWDKQALDLLHATLVDRHLRVEVVGEPKNPLDAIVFIGDIDIGRMLVANGFARRG